MLRVSQYTSHQPKAAAGILTLIWYIKMFTTQCQSSMRNKLYQRVRPNRKDSLETQQAEIQTLQPPSSSDHNISCCTMFTKWATIFPDQNQTYNKILSSTDKKEDKVFLDAPGVTSKIIPLNFLSANYINCRNCTGCSAGESGNAHWLLTVCFSEERD